MRQQPQIQQQQRPPQPPRPHSADFLEYEATRKPNPQTPTQVMGQPRCPQRPKSSLDVVNPADVPPPNDNYFYSEERSVTKLILRKILAIGWKAKFILNYYKWNWTFNFKLWIELVNELSMQTILFVNAIFLYILIIKLHIDP